MRLDEHFSKELEVESSELINGNSLKSLQRFSCVCRLPRFLCDGNTPIKNIHDEFNDSIPDPCSRRDSFLKFPACTATRERQHTSVLLLPPRPLRTSKDAVLFTSHKIVYRVTPAVFVVLKMVTVRVLSHGNVNRYLT